ncbi:MAG: hypothetical protein Q8O45_07750 [Desulfurivibrionaceae bacterium]|nr:hypothetical protein [Desulfurivibrionaceae bacterium]
MKKVLSTVAALGLVAGLASTASAVEFKMSGKYLVEGAYLSDARGTGMDVTEAAGESNPSDAYWLHTFEIKPTMKVNDKISMSSTIRLADDTFWGNQADGDVQTAGTTVGPTTGDIYVHHLYMDYASPIGKTRLGRVPTGGFGTNYMDFDTRGNRIMLWPSALAGGPWSTLFYIQKSTENTQIGVANAETDADTDVYVGRLYYKTDSIDSGIHYGYTNNMVTTTQSDRRNQVVVYGKYKMDNYFLNAELTYNFGEVDYDAAGTPDRDVDSWAGMLQVGTKIDALTPSLMYFYAQGQDMNENAANGGDIENALGTGGTGELFEPLYILTGRHTGMLNADIFSGNTSLMSTAGVHGVVLAADYAVSDRLKLHGAIGWAQADEAEITGYTNRDDDYGWEYNLGAAYKLLDNLTYEAHFGYLDTGDYFKSTATTDDTENVYLLTHSLTMTF